MQIMKTHSMQTMTGAPEAHDIWKLIQKMDGKAWVSVVEYVAWGLEYSGLNYSFKQEPPTP